MARQKRRPAQDWRHLATEVAVVVIGVLLALMAQQAAEALNWAGKVRAGREAIREELVASTFAAKERVLIKACLENRLTFLQGKLEAAGDRWEGQPWSRFAGHPASEGQAYGAPVREWNSEVWRALVADGTASHFPRAEMLRLTAIYQYVDALRADNIAERAAIPPVTVLGRSFALSDAARARSEVALEEQKGINRMAALGGAQLLEMIARAGMSPSGGDWEKELAALRYYQQACEAGRPVKLDEQGYPVEGS